MNFGYAIWSYLSSTETGYIQFEQYRLCVFRSVWDVDKVNLTTSAYRTRLHVTVVVTLSKTHTGGTETIGCGGGGTAGGYFQYVHSKQDSVIIYGYRGGGTEQDGPRSAAWTVPTPTATATQTTATTTTIPTAAAAAPGELL